MNRTETTDNGDPAGVRGSGRKTSTLPLCDNSGIRDNHNRGAVADFLREKIKSGSHLSVVSATFTIYAYAATFRKRAASGLESARDFILPDERGQVHEKADLELVTWLVIKEPDHAC